MQDHAQPMAGTEVRAACVAPTADRELPAPSPGTGGTRTVPGLCTATQCQWEPVSVLVLIPRMFSFTREVQSSLMYQRICSIILLKKKNNLVNANIPSLSLSCACIAIGSMISYEDILHSRICGFLVHEYSGSSSPFLSVLHTYPFHSFAPFFFFFSSGFN